MASDDRQPGTEPRARLCYQRRDSADWEELALSAAQYYEPTEDKLDWDSVPRHDHAFQYLAVSRAQLAQTVIFLYDDQGRLCCTLREMFWNRGRNHLIHRIDIDGELIITQLYEGDDDAPVHIVRYNLMRDEGPVIEHFVNQRGYSNTLVSQLFPDPEMPEEMPETPEADAE